MKILSTIRIPTAWRPLFERRKSPLAFVLNAVSVVPFASTISTQARTPAQTLAECPAGALNALTAQCTSDSPSPLYAPISATPQASPSQAHHADLTSALYFPSRQG